MVAALVCVTVVAVAALAAAVHLGHRVLDTLDREASEYRRERAMLIRALVAKSGIDLAQMERAAGHAEQAALRLDPRRPFTPEDIEADLAKYVSPEAARTIVAEAGLDGVPARPEGL